MRRSDCHAVLMARALLLLPMAQLNQMGLEDHHLQSELLQLRREHQATSDALGKCKVSLKEKGTGKERRKE